MILFIICTHRSLKLTIIFWQFLQFLKWLLSPTACLNYCPSRAKLVLSWICCPSVTVSCTSPWKPPCTEHVEPTKALCQLTQLCSTHQLLPWTKPCSTSVTISIELHLLKVLQTKESLEFITFQVLQQLKDKEPESDTSAYTRNIKNTPK